jgi:hypothetical protein
MWDLNFRCGTSPGLSEDFARTSQGLRHVILVSGRLFSVTYIIFVCCFLSHILFSSVGYFIIYYLGIIIFIIVLLVILFI